MLKLKWNMFKRKLRHKLCKHKWSPITLEVTKPECYPNTEIKAFAKCYTCGIVRLRVHSVSNRRLRNKFNNGARDLDTLSWAVAGALAADLYGDKLTNYHLGWVD